MARLNRSSLPFIGLMITAVALSSAGCVLDPYGLPNGGTTSTSASSSSGGGAGGEAGMGGMGGMGGAGGGMVCKPGSKNPCYTGPVETTNKGNCKLGTQTCLADGTGYEATCVGEVLPTLEDCVTPGDEDCDGLSDLEDSECKCTQANSAVPCLTMNPGVCAEGMGICSADGRSISDCAPVNVPSPENCAANLDEDCDGVVAPACSGDLQWSFVPNAQMSTTKDDVIFATAPIPGGGYVIAGMVDGTLGADLYGVSAGTIYIAKLDIAGAVQWENRYTSAAIGTARGVDVDTLGNIYVVGEFEGSVKFDGVANEMSVGGGRDIFMLKLDGAGQYLWHKRFGVNNNQVAADVAVDADGSPHITGFATNDAFSFGGASLDPDGADVFIAKFDTAGNHVWSQMFGNAGAQFGRAVEITKDGDLILAGVSDNNTNLGGSQIPKGGGRDVFVARYTKDKGMHVWSKLYGLDGDQFIRGTTIANDGNLLITGGFGGNILWETNNNSAAVGVLDLFVAKLDVLTGNHLQHFQAGKTLSTTGTAVGMDAAGNITISGYLDGTMEIGGQVYATTGSTDDTFQLKLKGGDWAPLWTKTYGKAGNQYAFDLAVNDDGSSLIAGGFYVEFDAPPNAIVMSQGGADIFAVLAKP